MPQIPARSAPGVPHMAAPLCCVRVGACGVRQHVGVEDAPPPPGSWLELERHWSPPTRATSERGQQHVRTTHATRQVRGKMLAARGWPHEESSAIFSQLDRSSRCHLSSVMLLSSLRLVARPDF